MTRTALFCALFGIVILMAVPALALRPGHTLDCKLLYKDYDRVYMCYIHNATASADATMFCVMPPLGAWLWRFGLPSMAAIGVTYLMLRLIFATDLR